LKKVFKLQEENKNSDRLVEAIKHDIRKYIKRERTKKLPQDFGFWDFDCQFGQTSETAKPVHSAELTIELDKALAKKWEACYVEIIAKACQKPKTAPTTKEA
jgi:hypothetical protein